MCVAQLLSARRSRLCMIYKNTHPQNSRITKAFVKKPFVFISFNGAPQLYLMSNCFFVFDLHPQYYCRTSASAVSLSVVAAALDEQQITKVSFWQFILFGLTLFIGWISPPLSLCHVHFLCQCIVFCPSVEFIHATLDLNSDMQHPWALSRDGYMNSI